MFGSVLKAIIIFLIAIGLCYIVIFNEQSVTINIPWLGSLSTHLWEVMVLSALGGMLFIALLAGLFSSPQRAIPKEILQKLQDHDRRLKQLEAEIVSSNMQIPVSPTTSLKEVSSLPSDKP